MDIDERECLIEAGYSEEEINDFFKDKLNNKELILNEDTGCSCLNECKNKLPNNLPDMNKIIFKPDLENKLIRFNYQGNNKLTIKTPRIFVPFGIDSYYKNWSINFELKNKDCEGIKQFKQFLFNFEDLIVNKLEIDRSLLNTQFKIHRNFNTEFYGRIRNQYGKCLCTIEDKRKSSQDRYINVFKFPKEVYVKVEMTTDGIWKLNNMFCYKFVVTKLTLVD